MKMDSKHMMPVVVFSSMLLLMLAGIADSDLSKDRQECAEQLVGLATCLPYVGGEAKTPTLDCCTGMKQVLQKSKKCLCVLIKDRNDPSLGLKINATLALSLPDTCHAPANISECPALLNLPPNSPDAKIFEDYAKGAKKSNSTATTATGYSNTGGSSAAITNDGTGKGKRWLRAEMGWGVVLLIITVVFHFLTTYIFDA